MKIIKLSIKRWRAFTDIEITIPKESTLIALIGENGAGKSSILDIINTAAHYLGLASGVDIPRGNPFNDEHEITVEFFINPDIEIQLPNKALDKLKELEFTFNGEILLTSKNTNGQHIAKISIPSISDEKLSEQIGNAIIESIRNKKDTFHLSLDADRAYPPKPIQSHEYAQSLDQDWENIQFKKHRAHVSSRNKYEEWMKFCIGTEAKKATEFYQQQRQFLMNGNLEPKFSDHFDQYGKSITKVLPHLQFLGVDTKEKTLIFNSTGSRLTFNQLSGGEREIAFVVGQIRRFELENGILLIDEPELHLNPDMVRTWISYLRDTVKDGQTWIATHSMEAVEAAGLECTFVIERNNETKQVNKVTSLYDQPALQILSASVGSPAFSISKKAFVFIEGDRQGVERDKFYRLLSLINSVAQIRFMEGGGCNEVIKKLEACKILAESSDQQINVGAIIDRDFRNEDEIQKIIQKGAFVLPFHEIENAFLYPPALNIVLDEQQHPMQAHELILKLSDKISGKWILERTKHISKARLLTPRKLNTTWANLNWETLSINKNYGEYLKDLSLEDESLRETFLNEIAISVKKYEETRSSKELWIHCEGKQILSMLPSEIGFSKQISLMNTICTKLKSNKNMCDEIFSTTKNYILSTLKI